MEPIKERAVRLLHLKEETFCYGLLQILKTWIIIFTGELFFRANGLGAGIHMFRSMFQDFQVQKLCDGTLLNLGLDKADYFAILAGCLVVAAVGMIKERKLLGESGMDKFCLPIRWAVYYGLILAVVIFGAYGIGYQQVDMIYAGF